MLKPHRIGANFLHNTGYWHPNMGVEIMGVNVQNPSKTL